jgi:hypothetical protein
MPVTFAGPVTLYTTTGSSTAGTWQNWNQSWTALGTVSGNFNVNVTSSAYSGYTTRPRSSAPSGKNASASSRLTTSGGMRSRSASARRLRRERRSC